MSPPIVAFTTDFGESDGYVAQMKGVVLSAVPGAVLVDVSHRVPPQDVARAAGLPLRPLGWRPWIEVAMATLGIYGVLLGMGWWLLGQPLQGTLVMGVAAFALVVVVRGVSRTPAQAVPEASPEA